MKRVQPGDAEHSFSVSRAFDWAFIHSLVLVKPRKTCPNMTEKLLTGMSSIKPNKQTNNQVPSLYNWKIGKWDIKHQTKQTNNQVIFLYLFFKCIGDWKQCHRAKTLLRVPLKNKAKIIKLEFFYKQYNENKSFVISKPIPFSKTCLKPPLKNRQNKDINDKW